MIENVGVAVGIGSEDQSVQLLFPFSVSEAAILSVGSWLTSGNVGQCRTMSKILYSSRARPKIGGGVEVGIAAPSLAVQKLFPLPA